jgi:hypothetical protein
MRIPTQYYAINRMGRCSLEMWIARLRDIATSSGRQVG